MASWLQQQANSGNRYAMRASQDLEAAEEANRTPPSVRRSSAALRASVLEIPSEMSPGRSERAFRSGNERLYEAYNDLHALAQDFEKPFDAPAILVVGHQTDGKSGEPMPQGLQGPVRGWQHAVVGVGRPGSHAGSRGSAALAAQATAARRIDTTNRRPTAAAWCWLAASHCLPMPPELTSCLPG